MGCLRVSVLGVRDSYDDALKFFNFLFRSE